MIKAKHVFITGCLLSIIAHQFHYYLWMHSYDQLMALSDACLLFTIVMMSTGQFFWLAKFFFLTTVINVLDEFIFLYHGWHNVEYIFWLIIFIYFYLNRKQWRN